MSGLTGHLIYCKVGYWLKRILLDRAEDSKIGRGRPMISGHSRCSRQSRESSGEMEVEEQIKKKMLKPQKIWKERNGPDDVEGGSYVADELVSVVVTRPALRVR
jgi:hypothetical protein